LTSSTYGESRAICSVPCTEIVRWFLFFFISKPVIELLRVSAAIGVLRGYDIALELVNRAGELAPKKMPRRLLAAVFPSNVPPRVTDTLDR